MSATSSAFSPANPGWLPEALQSSHSSGELMNVLFEGNPDMVVLVDSEQRIVATNSCAQRELGYSNEELIGRQISILLPEAARKRHNDHVRAFLTHPATRSMGSGMDLKARDARGNEFPVDVMLRPF